MMKNAKMNTASGGRCRFTDEDGFCTNENMQGGGFRCFGAGCECREPIRGPKPAAPIQMEVIRVIAPIQMEIIRIAAMVARGYRSGGPDSPHCPYRSGGPDSPHCPYRSGGL